MKNIDSERELRSQKATDIIPAYDFLEHVEEKKLLQYS